MAPLPGDIDDGFGRCGSSSAGPQRVGPGFDEEVVRNTLMLTESETLEPPKTSEFFEKFFCKKLTDEM